MKCPNCGSERVIWDYARGYSVCTSCGLVIEQLYEEFLWSAKHDSNDAPRHSLSVREAIAKSRCKVYDRSMRRKLRMISLYEYYSKRARKNVTVNIDNLRNGKGRIYEHVRERELVELLERDKELKNILNDVIERDPILSSRTLRGKVALALMIREMKNGAYPNVEEISRITGISRTHARRLLAMLQKRLKSIALSA